MKPAPEQQRIEITYEINGITESAVVTLEPGERIEPGDDLMATLCSESGNVILVKSDRYVTERLGKPFCPVCKQQVPDEVGGFHTCEICGRKSLAIPF